MQHDLSSNVTVQRRARIRRGILAAVIGLSLSAGMSPVGAATGDNETAEKDRFSLAIGQYYVTRTNGQIRLDDNLGLITIGTSIDWDRDLGGDTTKLATRIDGFYRFTPKHRMDFSWYKLDRHGQVIATRGLVFGSINFPAGSSIDSEYSTGTTKLSYTYSFYRVPEIEAGLSIGLHVTQLLASLQATGLGLAEKATVTAPLPVFGFRLDYALTPRWSVRTKYELFFLDKLDTYRGSLTDFSLAFENKTFNHVGFGFGLNRNTLDVEANSKKLSGAFTTITSGYMLYLLIH